MRTRSHVFCQSFLMILGLLTFLLILGACQSSESVSTEPSFVADTPLPLDQGESPTTSSSETPSQELVGNTPMESTTSTDVNPSTPTIAVSIFTSTPSAALLVHDDAPLEFTFPTPGEEPVSVWRPPLYEVPWSPGPYDHFYFVRPIAVDEVNWPLPDYRYGGSVFGPNIVHTGIDIDASKGTPILAAGGGKVTWAGNGLYFGVYNPEDPYGNAVVIEHDFGYGDSPLYTVYAHMERVDVVVGQRVEIGDQLGIVGETGNTTGPHLHFEVRLGRNSYYVTRNPELWISPPQGWGILVGRLVNDKGSVLQALELIIKNADKSRVWKIKTYTLPGANSDDYYNENLVLSDLPTGDYVLEFTFEDNIYEHKFNINGGRITYFTFSPRIGFKTDLPEIDDDQEWLPNIEGNH